MTVAAAPIAAKAVLVRKLGGPFSIEDVEVMPPREREVRVRMVGIGMCHTDLVARDGFCPIASELVSVPPITVACWGFRR